METLPGLGVVIPDYRAIRDMAIETGEDPMLIMEMALQERMMS